MCLLTSSGLCQMFEYSRTNRGFDLTNLWRHTVWQIHDLTSNIRIFGFDRVKIPFTARHGTICTSEHAGQFPSYASCALFRHLFSPFSVCLADDGQWGAEHFPLP